MNKTNATGEAVIIYGLIDPRDQQIKYIGQTIDADRRLREHIASKEDTPKGAWIRELRAVGLAPSMVVLDVIDGDRANSQEIWWILFCRHKGWQSVNGTYPSAWRADFATIGLAAALVTFSQKVQRASAVRVGQALVNIDRKWANIIVGLHVGSLLAVIAAVLSHALFDDIGQSAFLSGISCVLILSAVAGVHLSKRVIPFVQKRIQGELKAEIETCLTSTVT